MWAAPAKPRARSGTRSPRPTSATAGTGGRSAALALGAATGDWKRQHRAHLPIVDDKPGTVALVVWASQNLHATWTYHRTHADAAAHAPGDGTPYTIINVAQPKLRPPKINWPIVGTP